MKMKRSYCNPLDLGYRYQHMMENGKRIAYREAADPTLIYFKGVYYLFASMSGGFWHSSDLTDWKYRTNRDLLIYDYAPDVRQVGEYLYFCASRRGENCPILRTKDPLSDTFEQVSAPFDFWDPDLFCDDDGRVYLYWGCGNTDPIYGIEMDPDTMLPIGERRELIFEQADTLGYERCGENGNVPPKETSPVYQALKPFVNPATGELQLPQTLPAGGGFNREKLVKMFRSIGKPYIEGAFMTKHNGKYYLQYASPATQFNTYCDGVYVADAPLPTDVEQYAAAIQSATVEIDRLDPRTGARTGLTERPYSNADYENNGCFIGVYNGKAYFEEREIIPGSGFRRTVLTTVDAAGRAETVWDPWPQAEWVLGDDGGRYIWLYRDNYNTSYAACALLDTETGQITPVTQALQTGSGAVSLRGKAHDGRWLVVIGADSAGRTTAYGLIAADQFAAGSTDWQPVTMWQG